MFKPLISRFVHDPIMMIFYRVKQILTFLSGCRDFNEKQSSSASHNTKISHAIYRDIFFSIQN